MFPQPQPVFLDEFLDDSGVVTPEFSVLMIVAASMAALLFVIVHSDAARQALASMVQRALSSPV